MKPVAVVGLLACAVALGAQVVGRVVLPELSSQGSLIDANLAAALTAPLQLRLAELTLAANLIIAATAGRWLSARWATSVALVLVGLSGLQRYVLLPMLHGAWAKTDLVASRPIEHVLTANSLVWQETILVAVMAILLLVLLVRAAQRMSLAPAVASKPSNPSNPSATESAAKSSAGPVDMPAAA